MGKTKLPMTPAEKELREKWESEKEYTEFIGGPPKLIESNEQFQEAILDLRKGKGKPVTELENVKAIKCIETKKQEEGWDKCAVFDINNVAHTYEGVKNVLLEPHGVSRLLSSDKTLFVEFTEPKAVLLFHKTPNISDFNPEMLTIAKTPEQKQEMGILKGQIKQAEAFNKKNEIKDDPSSKAVSGTEWFEKKEKERKIETEELTKEGFADVSDEQEEENIEKMLKKLGLIP